MLILTNWQKEVAMIKHILFATDLGLYGPYLMKQLASIVQSTGASVDILHAIEPMGLFAESIIDTYMPDKEREYLRNKGIGEVIERIRLQVIDTLKSEYADSLQQINFQQVLVEVGMPADVIVKQAQLSKADLIVIGSHGQQAYSGGVLGSVVSKVLQSTPVPVLMIPMVSLEDLARR
jgi:nucleotide-binding universal stress UspA family protein